LDHSTIKYADQNNNELFDDYKSVELEFKEEAGKSRLVEPGTEIF